MDIQASRPRLGDVVEARSKVEFLRRNRIAVFKQELWNNGTLVAQNDIKAAFVSSESMKIIAIPDEIVAALAKTAGGQQVVQDR